MLETASQYQQQIWAAQRLYRICRTLRNSLKVEPCLEQYESQVQLLTGEEISPAATAWIALIAEQLRSEKCFDPEQYVSRW